jgi:hypothetical protein
MLLQERKLVEKPWNENITPVLGPRADRMCLEEAQDKRETSAAGN